MGSHLTDQRDHDSNHANPLLFDLRAQRAQRGPIHDPGQAAAQLSTCLVLQLHRHHNHSVMLPVLYIVIGVLSKPESKSLHESIPESPNKHLG